MSLNALVRWLKPRELVFFDLLDASAANALEGAIHFEKGIREAPETWLDFRRSMKELEHKGDETTHRIVDLLNHTFVTPLEREDILALAHALDDVLDGLDAIAERLVLYDIQETRPAFLEMASKAVEGCGHLAVLTQSLRTMADLKGIHARIREVNALENQVDAIYHTALAEIFRDFKDPIELIKWKELLDTLERVMDGINHCAKVLGSTVMRNA